MNRWHQAMAWIATGGGERPGPDETTIGHTTYRAIEHRRAGRPRSSAISAETAIDDLDPLELAS